MKKSTLTAYPCLFVHYIATQKQHHTSHHI